MKRSTASLVLPAVVILAATLAAYVPAMRGGFVWDDDSYVTDNPTLRSAEGLGRIWFDVGAIPQYYPLVHTTFWLEYHIWGLDPAGFHVVNVCLHALAAILFWLVLRRLGVPGAWLAGAVFALHPVHVESAAWITERKNVLSGVFYLSAMLAYLRFEPLEQGRERGPRRWGYFVLALALFVCALLSKTVSASLPAAVLVLIWWKRGRIGLRDVLPLVPFFAVGVTLGLVTVWMEMYNLAGTGAGAVGEEWALSPIGRGLVAGRALWFYAGKLLWPDRLTFIYPRWQIDSQVWWQYLFPLAALAVMVGLWFWRRRIGRGPLAAVLLFAGTLVPALGFFNVYPFRYSFVADHFQYLGSLGLIALFAAVVTTAAVRFNSPRWARWAAAVVLLAVLGSLSWQQGYDYRDLETLWRRTLAKNPDAWMAHNNLGRLLCQRGDLNEGMSHLNHALRLKSDHAGAHLNLADALKQLGRIDEALSHATAAVELKPGWGKARTNLGGLLFAKGRVTEAAEQFRLAIEADPADYIAHNNLGAVYEGQGNLEEAVAQYGQALQIKPDYARGYANLGAVLYRLGRPAEAAAAFRRAVALLPGDLETRVNLGLALEAQGQIDQAIDQYRQVLRSDPKHTRARRCLDAVRAGQGQH